MRTPSVRPSAPETEATTDQEAVEPAGRETVGKENATVPPSGVRWAKAVPVASSNERDPTSETGAVPSSSTVRLEIEAGPPIEVRFTARRGAFAPESVGDATECW